MHILISREININVSVDRRDCHIVYERNAFWSAKWVILIDLQSEDVKASLINRHQLIVDPHCFLLKDLELAIAKFILLKLVKVIELYQFPYSDHVTVELDE